MSLDKNEGPLGLFCGESGCPSPEDDVDDSAGGAGGDVDPFTMCALYGYCGARLPVPIGLQGGDNPDTSDPGPPVLKRKPAAKNNPAQNLTACVSTNSLNWLQKAQLRAAQFYASLTGLTFGFGAGGDGGAGIGPKGSRWNVGFGGSASTLIVADASGNSGFLNSASGGLSFTKMSSPGSWWGAGAAAGPSFLVSPFSVDKIKGRSGSISAGGGSGVLGGGASLSTSGALTLTAGWGAGAELGISPQGGTSQFIPFCH